MFIDARTLDDGASITADVCIIGAGVAGITLALEFDRLGIQTCVLESGGFAPDDQTRDLYRGESVALPYRFADGCRSRFLGGSSNCWGGWCAPLDPLDFQRRDWIPDSGWPVTRDVLEPYYRRTHAVLKLGPYEYDPAFWERAVGRRDAKRFPLPSGRVFDAISQFSPPARMGKLYRGELDRSRHVRVYLYANAVNIQSDRPAHRILHVDVATLTGRKHTAKAKLYVLGTGGIENPRLLLVSNKVEASGLGNGHDLVGRYFMDHPRILSGSIRFAEKWTSNKLFDIKFHYQNPAIAAHGTSISAQFGLAPEVQQREGVANARVWFSSVFPGEGTEAADALIRMKHRLEDKDQQGWSLAQDLSILARHPLNTAGFVLARYLKPRFLLKDVNFQAIVEPEPDPDARVTLSGERDRLGLNRVRVGWKLGPITRRTFDRNFAILADELEATGAARVRLDAPLEGRSDWPATLHQEGTWHHMGTTRMHDSPRYGVVDRNSRMHGVSNLFIAGSSVFPTAGANLPTTTIVALSLRLAEYIAMELRSSPAILDTHASMQRSAAAAAPTRVDALAVQASQVPQDAEPARPPDHNEVES